MRFIIEFSSLIKQDLQIKITNTIGKLVFLDAADSYIGDYKKEISLKNYSNGIYF